MSTLTRKKYLPRSTKPLRRKKWLPRSTKPIAKFGKAKLRRVASYNKHIQSAEWKRLRQERYKLAKGLCECPDCIEGRHQGIEAAFVPIEVWFRKGKAYGFDCHHTAKAYRDMPNVKVEDVRVMHPAHHDRFESQFGHRRQYMKTGKVA